MPFSAMDVLLGFVLPALWAGGVFALLSRFSPDGFCARFAPSVAFVGGFLLGYFSLKLGPLVPESHWHWLPYVMLLPLVVGPVSVATGVTLLERLLLYALASVIAFWCLVPVRESLEPSRAALLLVSAGAVVLLACLLEPLSRKFSGSFFALILFLTLTFAAVLLAFSGSLRFAQIAGAGAGALAGVTGVCRLVPKADSLSGLSIGFVLFLWGILLVGRVNSFSNVPLASYLLIPLAPASLWLVTLGPLSRLKGKKRLLVSASLPIVISLVAIALAALSEL